MHTMQCRLCGSSDLSLYYTQGDRHQYKLYKCSNCKLVNLALSNVPILDNQAKYAEKYIDPEIEMLNRGSFASDEYLRKCFKKYSIPKGKYLDIGCGNGALLRLMKMNGWQVRGLELSAFLAQKIKDRLAIDVDVANFMEFTPHEQYDLISLRHVLEHLDDSNLALSKINAMLKPGGYAMLEFPNIESLAFKIKRLMSKIGLRKKKYREGFVPAHCNEFSREPWLYLLNKTGFELISWQTYSLKPFNNAIYKILNTGSQVRTLIRKRQDAKS